MKYKCGTHMYEEKISYEDLTIVRTMRDNEETTKEKIRVFFEFICSSEDLMEYLYVVLNIYEKEEQGSFYSTWLFYKILKPLTWLFALQMKIACFIPWVMILCMLS